MRRIGTHLSEGMRLAVPVTDQHGRLLLPQATTMEAPTIERLMRLGVDTVCVEDPRFDGLKFEDAVDGSLRRSVQALLARWAAELAGGHARPCVDLRQVERLVSDLNADMMARRLVPLVLLPAWHPVQRPAVQVINATRLTLLLAAEVGLSQYATDMAIGAFVRDVGLLTLPEFLRRASDPLGPSPGGLLSEHPTTGLACLMNPGVWSPLSKVVIAQHHERPDGSGYPRGLAGDQVHRAAALVGAIDTYLNLIDGGNGPACTPEQALDCLLALTSSSMDLRAVRGICATVGLYPPGTLVQLSTGEEAVVTEPGCGTRLRPRVRLARSGDVVDLQRTDAAHVQVLAVIDS